MGMTDIHVILWLGAAIGTVFLIGFYHLQRHLCEEHPLKMPRIARASLSSVVLIALCPLMVMPLYYHCPFLTHIGVGTVLSHHPLTSDHLLEACHAHHQDMKQATEEIRDNRVMRRVS